MGELAIAPLVWAIPGLPLLGFVLIMFWGGPLVRKLGNATGKRLVGGLATALVFGSFVISVLTLAQLLRLEPDMRRSLASLVPLVERLPWIEAGPVSVHFTALVDPLSVLMCLIVTGVGGLIHLYATGYMAEDRDYARFFAYFNLFIFAMLVLSLGESLLLMFVGWEGVGLCSYLLISFWYDDEANAKAGNKAFIVNRVGDVGFMLGMLTTLAVFGTLSFHTPDHMGVLDMAARKVTAGGPLTASVAGLICALLFIGACGKSAQFPLHVWLPDAMAGPTPVSALIHAATMVTAGVVMVTRMSPLFVQAPTVLFVVACVGLFTALFAATIALTQTDIKKVLAYSTVSQLGFMFLGCGAAAFGAGMFHVTTHAFFKALLFLGAGSVIHGLSGEQDMRRMGGLGRYMKTTYWTMVVGWAAISGFPGLAGYWSKDAILGFASGIVPSGMLLYAVGTFTAFLTGIYMTRLMAKTFWTAPRLPDGAHHPHESPPSMLVPLIILAALSVVGGWIGTPFANAFERFLEPALPPASLAHVHEGIPHAVGLVIGAIVAIAAMVAGWLAYRGKPDGQFLPDTAKARNPLYRGASALWGVDGAANLVFVRGGGHFANMVSLWIDRRLIDGIVNAVAVIVAFVAEIARGSQSGYVRFYVKTMLAGALLVLAYALLTAGVK
jgi:NADH-quinone oxidoreductase subunit L